MKLKQFVIGEAAGTVSCLRYSSGCSECSPEDALISAGWDGSVSVWDARARQQSNPNQQTSLRSAISGKAKAYSMDLLGDSYYANGKYDAIAPCSSQQIHSKSHNTTFGNSTVLLKSSTPTSTTASAACARCEETRASRRAASRAV